MDTKNLGPGCILLTDQMRCGNEFADIHVDMEAVALVTGDLAIVDQSAETDDFGNIPEAVWPWKRKSQGFILEHSKEPMRKITAHETFCFYLTSLLIFFVVSSVQAGPVGLARRDWAMKSAIYLDDLGIIERGQRGLSISDTKKGAFKRQESSPDPNVPYWSGHP
ncbi:hypothetical protein EV363DRAFT_1461416 [Boletus edulis]|nr:hypothetical protein EV363DRAFT_1461416 [Boletus edulis]